MFACAKRLIDPSPGVKLTTEERNLFSVACKSLVGAKRAAVRTLASTCKEYETNNQREAAPVPDEHVQLAKDYLTRVKREIESFCNEVVRLFTSLLASEVEHDQAEAQMFYLKTVGDYYRYICECVPDENKKNAISASESCYARARAIGEEKLPPTHPILLSNALNFAVCKEEQGHLQEARDIARRAYDAAILALDSLDEDSYKDTTLIMQLLRDFAGLPIAWQCS